MSDSAKGLFAALDISALVAGVFLSVGCSHAPERETQDSRNRIECLYDCRFEKNLYGPALDTCIKKCE